MNIALFLGSISVYIFAQTLPMDILNVLAPDYNYGSIISLSEIKNNKASVFLTLLPGCPICRKQAFTLNELSQRYKNEGIKFYGVWYPGVDSLEMKKYIVDNKINFSILTDVNCQLTTMLGAEIAPDVVVLDSNLKVLYRGKIDNWFEAIGKRKPRPTEYFLDNALKAIVENKPISIKSTQPVGCIIECARRNRLGQPLPGR
jgi:peroxiredoxin